MTGTIGILGFVGSTGFVGFTGFKSMYWNGFTIKVINNKYSRRVWIMQLFQKRYVNCLSILE